MLAIPEKLAPSTTLCWRDRASRWTSASPIKKVSDSSGIFGIGALLYRRGLHCQGLPNSLGGPAVLNPVFYALIVISFPINLPSSSLSQRTFFMTSLFSVPELLQE